MKCPLITTLAIAASQQWEFIFFVWLQPVHGLHDQNMNWTCLSFINRHLHTFLITSANFLNRVQFISVKWAENITYRQVFNFISTIGEDISVYLWRMRPNWKSSHQTWTLISNQLNDFLILLPRTNHISLENEIVHVCKCSCITDCNWSSVANNTSTATTWQHRFKSLIIRSICSEWYRKHITYNYESSPSK